MIRIVVLAPFVNPLLEQKAVDDDQRSGRLLALFVCLFLQQKVVDNDERGSQLSATTVRPLL